MPFLPTLLRRILSLRPVPAFRFPTGLLALGAALASSLAAADAALEVWYGDTQRVGHLGQPQPDFNLLGHVEPWRELDTLEWRLNQQAPVPLNFRAFRRLERDGDFNADIPIARLRPDKNTVVLAARFRDGRKLDRTVTIERQLGRCPLPFAIKWSSVSNPQDVGQFLDGRWRLDRGALRTAEIGYDRLFLVGDRDWENCRFKIWPQAAPEPADWTWVRQQAIRETLRTGGVALVAHYADVSFGDLQVRGIE